MVFSFFLYAVIEVRATATSHKDHFAWKHLQSGEAIDNRNIDLDLIEVTDDGLDIMTLNDRGRHFCGLIHFCTILLGGHYDL